MRLVVAPMQLEDIGQVLEVDRESYSTPWPASAYRRELLHNAGARYVVLREVDENSSSEPRPELRSRPFPFLRWPGRAEESSDSGRVMAYAGMWMMVDEAHITTIAVREEYRGRGMGELLLVSLLDTAIAMRAHRVTLEVRVSNGIAQSLYRKFGFEQVGLRPRYYSDNNEDAYIMTTGNIQSREYLDAYAGLVDSLRERLSSSDVPIEAAALGTSVHAGRRGEA
ncbi:MAG TPA: ribosomal protein S18-alanine N-acetyltransferase [Chloroflexota bacterium]|nr:ribosomal protein S18-alanine N-acetyltransferase [Chloroflexota bacterium]